MKRKVIHIDETKCNGCGACIPNCPEGALQVINGKVRLISDLFCDGLGACIGHCPQGAIAVEEREGELYDERRVMENIIKAGPEVIKAHLQHLRDHNQEECLAQAIAVLKEKQIDTGEDEAKKAHAHHPGCPGSRMIDRRDETPSETGSAASASLTSELRQWPVQLHLVNPEAPYFKNADLVISADCVPFTYADFHRRFLKGKALIVFCPKLDHAEDAYVEKLTALFNQNDVRSVTLVHMEVPCCFGVEKIVGEALRRSGKQVIVKDYTISLQGAII
jgi:ferredoxin